VGPRWQPVSIQRRRWLIAIGIAVVLLAIAGSILDPTDFLVTAIWIVAALAAILVLVQVLPRRPR
jgi:hypothetical protein